MEFNRDLRHEMYTEAVVDGNTNEMYLSRLALQRAIRSCDPERSETSVAQLSTALVLASSTNSVGSGDPSSSLPSASPSAASLSLPAVLIGAVTAVLALAEGAMLEARTTAADACASAEELAVDDPAGVVGFPPEMSSLLAYLILIIIIHD